MLFEEGIHEFDVRHIQHVLMECVPRGHPVALLFCRMSSRWCYCLSSFISCTFSWLSLAVLFLWVRLSRRIECIHSPCLTSIGHFLPGGEYSYFSFNCHSIVPFSFRASPSHNLHHCERLAIFPRSSKASAFFSRTLVVLTGKISGHMDNIRYWMVYRDKWSRLLPPADSGYSSLHDKRLSAKWSIFEPTNLSHSRVSSSFFWAPLTYPRWCICSTRSRPIMAISYRINCCQASFHLSDKCGEAYWRPCCFDRQRSKFGSVEEPYSVS